MTALRPAAAVEAAASASIDVRGLTKRYRSGIVANNSITLSVDQGTVFGMLGPNGAGKTTLVRQLTGELVPSNGHIRILGRDIADEPMAVKAAMGVVPQEARPYPHLRPHEHLTLFGRLHGLDRDTAARRADELMRVFGLDGHVAVPAERLSGGLKRKLLVGVALMARPPILILDEPTTGLDPHSRREVWSMLESLRGSGTTILITTHYMDEAEVLCDRVAVIARGRVIAQGTVEQLRGMCRNRFKATFGDGDGLARETLYGASYDEVAGALAGRGIVEYSIGKTSLEDLYLELTSERLEEDGDA